jgi:hypothetical protein
MPRPDEIAEITANGSIYRAWEWVEFERRIGTVTSHLRVRVAETGANNEGWAKLRLKVGDKMTARLAGQLILEDGEVSVRQSLRRRTLLRLSRARAQSR